MQKVDAFALAKQIGDCIIAERSAHAGEIAQLKAAQADELAQKDGALDAASIAMQALQAQNADLQGKLTDALAQHAVVADLVPDDFGAELQKLALVAKG